MAGNSDSGRKPLEDEKQVKRDIAITPSLWDALKDYAKEVNTSVSALLRAGGKRTLREAGRWTDDTDA